MLTLLNKSKELEKEGDPGETSKPKLDLSFKDGQTIKINVNFGVSTFTDLIEKFCLSIGVSFFIDKRGWG